MEWQRRDRALAIKRRERAQEIRDQGKENYKNRLEAPSHRPLPPLPPSHPPTKYPPISTAFNRASTGVKPLTSFPSKYIHFDHYSPQGGGGEGDREEECRPGSCEEVNDLLEELIEEEDNASLGVRNLEAELFRLKEKNAERFVELKEEHRLQEICMKENHSRLENEKEMEVNYVKTNVAMLKDNIMKRKAELEQEFLHLRERQRLEDCMEEEVEEVEEGEEAKRVEVAEEGEQAQRAEVVEDQVLPLLPSPPSSPSSHFSPSARACADKQTKQKQNKCPHCTKSFSRSSNMKTHMSIHSGVKPHLCRQCRKTFTSSSNLKKHMRVHTGYKPFKCGVCKKVFARSDTLKDHMNYQHYTRMS